MYFILARLHRNPVALRYSQLYHLFVILPRQEDIYASYIAKNLISYFFSCIGHVPIHDAISSISANRFLFRLYP